MARKQLAEVSGPAAFIAMPAAGVPDSPLFQFGHETHDFSKVLQEECRTAVVVIWKLPNRRNIIGRGGLEIQKGAVTSLALWCGPTRVLCGSTGRGIAIRRGGLPLSPRGWKFLRVTGPIRFFFRGHEEKR